jgi:hypothetical protein
MPNRKRKSSFRESLTLPCTKGKTLALDLQDGFQSTPGDLLSIQSMRFDVSKLILTARHPPTCYNSAHYRSHFA